MTTFICDDVTTVVGIKFDWLPATKNNVSLLISLNQWQCLSVSMDIRLVLTVDAQEATHLFGSVIGSNFLVHPITDEQD